MKFLDMEETYIYYEMNYFGGWASWTIIYISNERRK